jgi:hypothetical protein
VQGRDSAGFGKTDINHLQQHGHGVAIHQVSNSALRGLRLSVRFNGNSDIWSIQFVGDPNVGTVKIEQSNLHMMSALILQDIMNFTLDQVTEEAVDNLVTEFLSGLLYRSAER